jgi:predicted O-methyltransferase YrrM
MFMSKSLAADVQRRPNLVVVRAGDGSLHRAWRRNLEPAQRNWDLCVSYFGDAPLHDARDCEILHVRKGNKWEPLWELFEAGVFVDYEYVWLPDDDLDTDWATINKLFRVAKAVGLELAQPALTPDSFIAHPIVRQVPGALLRFTNFVEPMAPLFSQSALAKCATTFRGNKSAWGVDYAWTAILGRPENKIAIIDAVPVKHTRPGGQAYDVDSAAGEMKANLEKYGAAYEAHEIARVPLDVLGQRGIVAAPPSDESAAPVQRSEFASMFQACLASAFGLVGESLDGGDLTRVRRLAAAIDSANFAATEMSSAREHAGSFAILADAMGRRTIEGLILEFGVYTGKTINHIASMTPQKVFGFDSFEGLPEDWRTDFPKGRFAAALPAVRDNVELVVGWFDATLPGFLARETNPISLLHVDCDLYSSTKTIFDLCRDRIRPGTVIVFDEYFNYVGWRRHEHKAFMEFIAETGLAFEYVGLAPSHQQVSALIR